MVRSPSNPHSGYHQEENGNITYGEKRIHAVVPLLKRAPGPYHPSFAGTNNVMQARSTSTIPTHTRQTARRTYSAHDATAQCELGKHSYLDRVQDAHGAGGDLVEVVAHALVQAGRLDDSQARGDTNLSKSYSEGQAVCTRMCLQLRLRGHAQERAMQETSGGHKF